MDISTVLFALMFPKYADMQNLIKLYTLCEVYYISVIHLGGTSGKEPTCQCRKLRGMPPSLRLGWTPGGGHSNPFQYSCLEYPMDRGVWHIMLHRIFLVSKSQTWLKPLRTHATNTLKYMYICVFEMKSICAQWPSKTFIKMWIS